MRARRERQPRRLAAAPGRRPASATPPNSISKAARGEHVLIWPRRRARACALAGSERPSRCTRFASRSPAVEIARPAGRSWSFLSHTSRTIPARSRRSIRSPAGSGGPVIARRACSASMPTIQNGHGGDEHCGQPARHGLLRPYDSRRCRSPRRRMPSIVSDGHCARARQLTRAAQHRNHQAAGNDPVASGRHQQRRNRFERDTDAEVGCAPDDGSNNEGGDQARRARRHPLKRILTATRREPVHEQDGRLPRAGLDAVRCRAMGRKSGAKLAAPSRTAGRPQAPPLRAGTVVDGTGRRRLSCCAGDRRLVAGALDARMSNSRSVSRRPTTASPAPSYDPASDAPGEARAASSRRICPPLPFQAYAPPRPMEAIARAVYRFAAEHPEVLSYVPCFCGCERGGHHGQRRLLRESPQCPGDGHRVGAAWAWTARCASTSPANEADADDALRRERARHPRGDRRKWVGPAAGHTPTPAARTEAITRRFAGRLGAGGWGAVALTGGH